MIVLPKSTLSTIHRQGFRNKHLGRFISYGISGKGRCSCHHVGGCKRCMVLNHVSAVLNGIRGVGGTQNYSSNATMTKKPASSSTTTTTSMGKKSNDALSKLLNPLEQELLSITNNNTKSVNDPSSSIESVLSNHSKLIRSEGLIIRDELNGTVKFILGDEERDGVSFMVKFDVEEVNDALTWRDDADDDFDGEKEEEESEEYEEDDDYYDADDENDVMVGEGKQKDITNKKGLAESNKNNRSIKAEAEEEEEEYDNENENEYEEEDYYEDEDEEKYRMMPFNFAIEVHRKGSPRYLVMEAEATAPVRNAYLTNNLSGKQARAEEKELQEAMKEEGHSIYVNDVFLRHSEHPSNVELGAPMTTNPVATNTGTTTIFPGPRFIDLNEELQESFNDFVEKNFVKFVPLVVDYTRAKEKILYRGWLKDMKEIVTGTPTGEFGNPGAGKSVNHQ